MAAFRISRSLEHVKGMASGSIYSGYDPDGVDFTWEWDFARSGAVGQISVSGVTGEGLHQSGITSYRYQTKPNGPEQVTQVADPAYFMGWLPFLFADNCTGMTFSIAMGGHQSANFLCNVFFW